MAERYIFKLKNQADPDGVIRPDKTINEDAIRDNWADLLRRVATIKIKENTASDIFRRLNSYSPQHALYQTLKAFEPIIKFLFILRYVDDLALRQAIEKQLNKVELANLFTRGPNKKPLKPKLPRWLKWQHNQRKALSHKRAAVQSRQKLQNVKSAGFHAAKVYS